VGDEHPDTLNAMNNLAGTVYAQGQGIATIAIRDRFANGSLTND